MAATKATWRSASTQVATSSRETAAKSWLSAALRNAEGPGPSSSEDESSSSSTLSSSEDESSLTESSSVTSPPRLRFAFPAFPAFSAALFLRLLASSRPLFAAAFLDGASRFSSSLGFGVDERGDGRPGAASELVELKSLRGPVSLEEPLERALRAVAQEAERRELLVRRLHANVHERGRDADLAREGHDGGGELALLRRVHRAVDHAHDAHGVHHPEHVFGEEGTDRAGHVPVVQPRLHERGGRLTACGTRPRKRQISTRASAASRAAGSLPQRPARVSSHSSQSRQGTRRVPMLERAPGRAPKCAASGGPTRRGRAEFLFVDFSAARRAPILSIVVHCTSLYTSRRANAASLCARSFPRTPPETSRPPARPRRIAPVPVPDVISSPPSARRRTATAR